MDAAAERVPIVFRSRTAADGHIVSIALGCLDLVSTLERTLVSGRSNPGEYAAEMNAV
jgi:hypothetical protein